jgi:hypothetical protein
MPRTNLTFEEDVIDRLARIETTIITLPDRVSSLEKTHNRVLGMAAVLSSGIGLVIPMIRDKLGF